MNKVIIKDAAAIEKMRVAGRLAAEVLDMIGPYVRPGTATEDLDKICHDYIVNVQKAIPALVNYKGYPKTICTSINHQVCHGIPGPKKLKNGDILNIDVTLQKDGYHGDTSRMFLVGDVSILGQRICRIAKECMEIGISMVKPGIQLGDIGHAIQKHAETHHFSVVREYCGHGVGELIHEPLEVLHYGKPGTGIALQEGMTFTIEPMINVGKAAVKLLGDHWTVVTRDKTLSAQWEHTLLVTKDGHEVLTLSSHVS